MFGKRTNSEYESRQPSELKSWLIRPSPLSNKLLIKKKKKSVIVDLNVIFMVESLFGCK